jgi:steroid delta-isomerase-like uncharacterized protein
MNKLDVTRSNIDAWNRHDVDAIQANYTEDGIYIHPSLPEPINGKSTAFAEWVRSIFVWSSDFQLDIVCLGDTGECVVTEWLAHGTNDGPGQDGTPPTGKTYTLAGVSVTQFEGDKVVKQRVYVDNLGLRQRLGLESEPVTTSPR